MIHLSFEDAALIITLQWRYLINGEKEEEGRIECLFPLQVVGMVMPISLSLSTSSLHNTNILNGDKAETRERNLQTSYCLTLDFYRERDISGGQNKTMDEKEWKRDDPFERKRLERGCSGK